jgi:hypothetical protein
VYNLTEQYRLLGCILSVKEYISHRHLIYLKPKLGDINEGQDLRLPSGCIRHGEEVQGTKGKEMRGDRIRCLVRRGVSIGLKETIGQV